MAFEGLEKGKEYEIEHKSGLLSDIEETLVKKTNDKLKKNIVPESNIEDVDILENTGKKLQNILNKYSMKNIISDTQQLNNNDIIRYIIALIGTERINQFNKPILKNNKLILSRKGGIEEEIKLDKSNLGTIRSSLLEVKGTIANIIQKNNSGYVTIEGKFFARPNRPDFTPVVQLKESNYINDTVKQTNETLSNLSKTFFEIGSSEINISEQDFDKIKLSIPTIINAINKGKKLQLTGMVDNIGTNPQKDNNPEKQSSNLSMNRAKNLKKFLIDNFKIPENKITLSDGGIKEERRVDFNFI